MAGIVPRFTHSLNATILILMLALTSLCLSGATHAQEDSSKSKAPKQVIIEREPLRVIDPDVYMHRFQLEPIKSLKINSPMNGIVAQVSIKRGDTIGHQQQLVRLDDRELKLQLEIASQSSSSSAQAEKDLANLRLERINLLAPFAGKIEEIHVAENTFVIAGTPLVTLIDDSSLQVTIPMERTAVNPGEQIELDIEGEAHSAKIIYIGALSKKWDTLRDLSKSVVAVTCEVDNSDRKIHVGQAVNSPLVPRHPVVEIPIDTLDNGEEGGRIVQILREYTVRELAVKTLGQVGTDRVFVSGLFAPGDDLITKSSQPLVPGTVVQSPTAKSSTKSGWNKGSSSKKSRKSNSPTF